MNKGLFYGALILSVLSVSSCQILPHQVDNPFIPQPLTLNVDAMMVHLKALEQIAKDHGGHRAVGSAGGMASAKYIVDQVKQQGLQAQLIPFENRNKKVGQNIIVEISGQSKDTAILIGGHYDSVEQGPGINDNGSGVALILELIKYYQQQKMKPMHTLYFAFWDSEEDGIGGAQNFVSTLSESQLKGIQAYINLDMVGTREPTVQIADGDHSSIAQMKKDFKDRGLAEADYLPVVESFAQVPTHPKDIFLEQSLRDYFKKYDVALKEDISTLMASDTAPFMGKVPVASLIFFNEKMKGNVLEFAPCYHQACDTLSHVDPQSLEMAGGAVLHLIKLLERSSTSP